MSSNTQNIDLRSYGFSSCAMIVAHPDDETLWGGGTILMNPDMDWTVACLCRKSDPDRSARFANAMKIFNVPSVMGDVYDGPNQQPDSGEVEEEIKKILPSGKYDLIITHSYQGEYTRHVRHEEVSRAVVKLLKEGYLSAKELWMFAYEDGGKTYMPRPIKDADVVAQLPEDVFNLKYKMVTENYGFVASEYEAQACPNKEAFWRFKSAQEAHEHFEE